MALVKDKDEAFPFFVEQRYFDGYKPILEIIDAEETAKRGYGGSGYHKERLIDEKGRGYYDLHITGFKTEQEANEFKIIVEKG